MSELAKEGTLSFSNRMYSYVKAIKGVVDAVVELVTNSNDAYESTDIKVKKTCIHVDIHNRELIVTDNALGMTGEEMLQKLSIVGNYTANETSRGFFSRGAKDINGIGNVEFTAIRDGKLSCLTLGYDDSFKLTRENENVTLLAREDLGIPENGFHVRVKLLDFVKIPTLHSIANLPKFISLRDIFQDPSNFVCGKITAKNGVVVFDDRLIYERKPVKDLLLFDEEITLQPDGWPKEATFTMKLWEYEDTLAEENYREFREYGVIIKSKYAVHEITGFYSDIEHKCRKIIGEIKCDYIDTLMSEYDSGNRSEHNAIPVVTSDRIGLNRYHPFTKALFKMGHAILSTIIVKMYSVELDNNSFTMNMSEILENLNTEESDSFIQDVAEIYPYTMNSDVGTKEIKFLTPKTDNVIASNPDAKFNMKQLTRDVDTVKNGSLRAMTNLLTIKLFEDAKSTVSFNYFYVNNILSVELNTGHALLTDCVSKIENTDMFTITNIKDFTEVAAMLITDAIAESLAQLKMEKDETDAVASRNFSDLLLLKNQLSFKILKPMYTMLTNVDMIAKLITNEVI
jgi:hypothetical protein